MKTLHLIIAALVSMLLCVSSAYAADLVLVVNKSNSVVNVTLGDLKKYYEGTNTLWENGKKVDPADLVDSNPLAAQFSETVLGKDLEKKQRMWVRKIFRGEGTPPDQFADEASVIDFVSSHPGAVGYVSKGSVTDKVKAITVDGMAEF